MVGGRRGRWRLAVVIDVFYWTAEKPS